MKKIKLMLSALLVMVVLFGFSACGDGQHEIPSPSPDVPNYPSEEPDTPNHPSEEPDTPNHPSDDLETPSDPSQDPMTGYEYVGKKKPTEKKVVGDIVYYDGSATNILSNGIVSVATLHEATTGYAEGHEVALIVYSDENTSLGMALKPLRISWNNITNEMAENYPENYYDPNNFLACMVVPESLQSGWRFPTKDDLNKALENVVHLADTIAYLTDDAFYSFGDEEYESIWSSTDEGDSAYCLFYSRPTYYGSGSVQRIELIDKTSAKILYLPVHDF